MPEYPPSGVSENAAVNRAQGLSPVAIATVLADFQSWLTTEAVALAQREGETGRPSSDTSLSPGLDLHTLLGQLIGLRQEVNLQTRATRSQQELNAEMLQKLTQAFDSLRQAQARVQQAQQQGTEETLRPMLLTLTEVHDSLSLAAREMQRMQEAVLPVLEELTSEPARENIPVLPLSFWARWFGTARSDPEAADRQAEQRQRRSDAAERTRQMLASLVTGYTMSVKRVERALRQQGLEVMAVVGATFDPEQMEVLEAVDGTGRPAGEVLGEVRRGYVWNGRVFRYAQVRVARS